MRVLAKTKDEFYKEAYKEGYTDEDIKELIDNFPSPCLGLEDYYWEDLSFHLGRVISD